MPPRSARIGARRVQLTYWTADGEGSAQIKSWLDQELGDEQLKFLGSFINKCSQEMQKLKNVGTKWPSAEEKAHVSDLREVLRAQPLDVRAYIGLMYAYMRRDFTSGRYKTGFIPKPENADAFALMKGQRFLREHVFTRVERQMLAVAEGRVGELTPKEQRKIKNRAAWAKGQQESAARAARAAIAAEVEVEKSSLGSWAATKNAVAEVEEEIAVGESTKALGQVEISQGKAWEGDLADRTK